MSEQLDRIGRLAAAARGLEREGAYNGAKLVRLALGRELVRYAEAHAASGGAAVADAVERLVAADGAALPAELAGRIGAVAGVVRSGGTIPLADAPRARLCRVCGETFLGDAAPARCPVCESPALSFVEELPVWYLDPADRATILAAVAAGPRDLAGALAGRSDDALARPPAAGEWSARQTLEHLLFAEELFATRIGRLLDEDEPDFASRAVWAETPASDEGSVATADPASALAARWTALRTATAARLEAIPDAAWDRAGRHPEWGRVTVLSQAGYFARHQASHMAQLVASAAGRLPGGR